MAASNDDPPRRDPEKAPGELDDLFKLIDRLPFIGTLKHDLVQLRRLLYDRRTPRVVVVGAPGSGRTSLANALLRLPALPLGDSAAAPPDQWIRIDASGRHLDWIELASGPLDDARGDAVRRALDETVPDLAIVVARAETPEEGREGKKTLDRIFAMLDDAKQPRPPILGVVTHVDRVATPEASETGAPRFATNDLAKIDAATQVLKNELEAGGGKVRRPVPVLAGGSREGGDPIRWNVEEVADAIHDMMPDAAKVEAARALAVPSEVRRDLARAIVNHCATAAVTIGLMPVPFSDAILLMPLQGVMVSAIAYVAGQPWDRRAALEWLGSVGIMGGAAFGLRWGAQQLVKLIPGAGALVSGSVAGAGTLAIGRSAIAYFIDGPGQREPRPILPADASPPPPPPSPPS
jgi:uncharacterized protein (DUF697 family)